jgi:acetyltransferase-like isoleucine patch superfamily enzyme
MNKENSKHINPTDRPLLFIGSNIVLEKYTELCEELGITVAGILDNDYWGNTESLCGVPVVDTELNIDKYVNDYNFFCATNWSPINDPVIVRNRQKRHNLLALIRDKGISCISLVDPTARISRHSRIGQGVFIDCHVMVESGSTVGDFTNIYGQVQVGHNTTIKENCVLQRAVGLASEQILENDVYLSSGVKALKPGVTISSGTFVHELVYLARGTVKDEVVQFGANNTRRVQRPYDGLLETQ